MKNRILFLMLFVFISFSTNKEINAQTSLINCDGTVTCTLDANGWKETTLNFMYDNCRFNIKIKYAKCENGKSIIDIQEIYSANINNLPCPYPDASYMNEIIRFCLLKSPELFNLNDYGQLKEVWVKTFSCARMVPYPIIGLFASYTKFEPCNTNCCVTKYEIAKRYDGVKIETQLPAIDGAQIYGCDSSCSNMCWAHLMPIADSLINNSDFVQSGNCDLECYWRLNGNNNVDTTSFMGSINNMPVKFKAYNQEAMRILPNGNVGIGTENPTEKLVINGNLKAAGIKATGNIASEGTICAKEVNIVDLPCAWPDYVLVDDYNLLSFEDLEKSINENGTLPGVPSSADVKSNGVDVGAMQAILLKKVEELTLYVIQLNKDNQKLHKRNQDLEKKLKSIIIQ